MLAALISSYAFYEASAPYLAVMGALVLLTAVFIFWIIYYTRYIINGGCLLIFSGPFRWRIDINLIVEIRPSKNPISGPACSLDRLLVKYKKQNSDKIKSVIISPEKKQDFLDELAAKAPQLKKQDGNLLLN